MHKRVQLLLDKGLVPQRTPEWFEMRKGRITASEAASCFKVNLKNVSPYIAQFPDAEVTLNKSANPYCTYDGFMQRKLGFDPFQGNEATRFGNTYEPVATELYERLYGEKVHEFGFLQHDTIDYLGASPDGITAKGVMLEIKCPFRRKPNGVPPMYYFVQMQLQLEVCDLEDCDYMECEIKEYKKTLPSYAKYVGYRLPDETFMFEETVEKLGPIPKDATLFAIVNYYVSRVKRDVNFFNTILPDFRAAYEDWQEQAQRLQEEHQAFESQEQASDSVEFLL